MKLHQIALVIALLLPTLVIGEVIATMPNKAGGKLVLTNEICKHKETVYEELSLIYGYTKEGYVIEGCYTIEDKMILVVWKIADTKIMKYPLNEFTFIKQKHPTIKYDI